MESEGQVEGWECKWDVLYRRPGSAYSAVCSKAKVPGGYLILHQTFMVGGGMTESMAFVPELRLPAPQPVPKLESLDDE